MSIGSWTPAGETSIDRGFLVKAVEIAKQDQLEQLANHFDANECERYAPTMRLSQSDWLGALEDFDNDELRLLIKFFALAEMQLSGWEAGDSSPAIWASKVLKKRGERLSAEELLWLREHSTNRYIPNGRL